jgi:hypothetical protein
MRLDGEFDWGFRSGCMDNKSGLALTGTFSGP